MIDTSRLTASDLSSRLVPVALGGEIMSYGFARCFHEAYGVKTMVVSAVDDEEVGPAAEALVGHALGRVPTP